MQFDPRLLTPTGFVHKSVSGRTQQVDNIELDPWDSRSELLDCPPRPYRNTDELLSNEHERLFQSSPKPSSTSVDYLASEAGKFQGWQIGAILCVVVVAASLIINVTITAWASKTFGLSDGIGTIYKGPCPSVKKIGLWAHIAINVLSTTLLGASNFCMQCLCAPTRSEVDKAHADYTWLDIGIQSFRNLKKIKKSRLVLWLLLAASSIPLHLMFNSAIFVSLTANEYIVAAVTDDFVTGANWTLSTFDEFHNSIVLQMQQNISNYERLDPSTCIKDYGVDYVSSRRHNLVVVSGQSSDPLLGVLDWIYNETRNSWVCGTTQGPNKTLETIPIAEFDCSISVALYENEVWLMADRQVEYCLSQKVEDECRLQFAVPIMVIVLCCNFIKLLCMVVTIWKCREPTFVTLGDVLSSMLENPDRYTFDMCTATKKDFEKGELPDRGAKRWSRKRHFQCEAVGTQRWLLSNTMCAVACVALSIALRFAIHYTTTASDIKTLWSLGFGTVTASSLIRWSRPILGSPGLMKNVLLANSPQIILSLLYIVYNRMYTCMSFSREWHQFARKRQPLRVTSPRGAQRSTYFLSLPYRYLIPILIVSITTHWILSESLFLVSIDVFDEHGNLNPSQSILTCGFSCIALIFLIGIGWLVLIVGVGMGLRRFEGGMPLAGSCSAALSAACHPPEDEADAALVPVQWGVVYIEQGVGHCALSGRYVCPPISGRVYRGKKDD